MASASRTSHYRLTFEECKYLDSDIGWLLICEVVIFWPIGTFFYLVGSLVVTGCSAIDISSMTFVTVTVQDVRDNGVGWDYGVSAWAA